MIQPRVFVFYLVLFLHMYEIRNTFLREKVRMWKRSLAGFLAVCLFALHGMHPVKAQVELTSPSVILMESTTGQVLYEKNAAQRRSPASITKIMTLLLTFEALENGTVTLSDEVVTSEHASSMGGSQVFLETGEVQTLETLIKCIAVASGNDASVAVAEHIAGSEQAFVEKMNEKALQLGMVDTHFEDCCGLTDSENHYSCARDVAIMSRELTLHHPHVFDYTKIWMEGITHVTPRGNSEFMLSSTNKLLKQYHYTTGLKTGFTSKAGFCLSATASKDGIDLIAVCMGAGDSKTRNAETKALLAYGFSKCRLYTDENTDLPQTILLRGGVEEAVPIRPQGSFRYLDVEGRNLAGIRKEIALPDQVNAPAAEGEAVGQVNYYLGEELLGTMPILFAADIDRAGVGDCMRKVLGFFLF